MNGAGTHDLLAAQYPDLKRKVRKLPGVGPAAWRYLLNLSQVEMVKPDTIITRWVNGMVKKAGGQPIGQVDAANLLEAAARDL